MNKRTLIMLTKDDGHEFLVNPDHIRSVEWYSEDGSLLTYSNGDKVVIQETTQQVHTKLTHN